MSPKVEDKALVSTANAILATGKAKWFTKFTEAGIDKTTLSTDAQSTLGQDVDAFQRLSQLTKLIDNGKATDAQRKEATELVKKLEVANTAEEVVLNAAKTARSSGSPANLSLVNGNPSASGAPEDEVDINSLYCEVVEDGQGGPGPGASPPPQQEKMTRAEALAKLAASQDPEVKNYAEQISLFLRDPVESKKKAAQACLDRYIELGTTDHMKEDLRIIVGSESPPTNPKVGAQTPGVKGSDVKAAIDAQIKAASAAVTALQDANKESTTGLPGAVNSIAADMKTTLDNLGTANDPAKRDKILEKIQFSIRLLQDLSNLAIDQQQMQVRAAWVQTNVAMQQLQMRAASIDIYFKEQTVAGKIDATNANSNLAAARANYDTGAYTNGTSAQNMGIDQFMQGDREGRYVGDDGKMHNLTIGQYSAGFNEVEKGSRAKLGHERNLTGIQEQRQKREVNEIKVWGDKAREIDRTAQSIGGAQKGFGDIVKNAGNNPLGTFAAIVGFGGLLKLGKGGGGKGY